MKVCCNNNRQKLISNSLLRSGDGAIAIVDVQGLYAERRRGRRRHLCRMKAL